MAPCISAEMGQERTQDGGLHMAEVRVKPQRPTASVDDPRGGEGDPGSEGCTEGLNGRTMWCRVLLVCFGSKQAEMMLCIIVVFRVVRAIGVVLLPSTRPAASPASSLSARPMSMLVLLPRWLC